MRNTRLCGTTIPTVVLELNTSALSPTHFPSLPPSFLLPSPSLPPSLLPPSLPSFLSYFNDSSGLLQALKSWESKLNTQINEVTTYMCDACMKTHTHTQTFHTHTCTRAHTDIIHTHTHTHTHLCLPVPCACVCVWCSCVASKMKRERS